MTVNADEDIEIIPVSDPSTWGAFKLFNQYNWNSSFENTEIQTFSTSGQSTVTGEFNFSGQFTGSFDASVSLTYTGEIGDSGLGVASIIATGEQHSMIGSSGDGSIEMTITPNSSGATGQQNATYACVYNAQSTASNALMTCTPSAASVSSTFTLPNETITFDCLDILTTTQNTFLVKMMQSGSEVGSINGALYGTLGGSGSVQLSGSNNETTTTTNNTKYEFNLPYMIHDGDLWKPITEYNVKYNIGGGSKDDPLVVAFMSDSILLYFMRLYLCNNNRQEIGSNQSKRTTRYLVGNSTGYQLNCIEYFNGANVYIDVMQSVNTAGIKLYPLYVGRKSYMSDELYRFIYGSDRTIEKIDDQITADQQHHDEMMDTSDSAKIQTDGDALVEDADEKFGDLFFPLNHAIETANDLANVDATGIIRLPAIFSDNEYWYLDLTQIEQKIPDAWHFIQALCQLAVAIYMIHGLYNLFFGGSNDS